MFYGSVADFKAYHTSRGKTLPSWSDEVIEAALLVASEWLDNIYKDVFSGYPIGGFDQEREWPRESALSNTYPQKVFSITEIPVRVEHATYEAAFREAASTGALNVDFTPNKYTSASVDGAVSVKYAQNLTINTAQVQIRIIDQLIYPLIDPLKAGAKSGLSGDSRRS